MIINIELRPGKRNNDRVTKKDINENIAGLKRAINNTKSTLDKISLNSTLSILEGIKEKLPYD